MDTLAVEWNAHRVRIALLVVASYIGCVWLSERFLPHPGALFPAAAIALSALFLEGLGLWPAIYIAAFVGGIIAHYPLIFLITMPVAQTLQALAGAAILRKAPLDPLFRSSRGIFLLLGTVAFAALIVPTAGSLTNELSRVLTGVSYPIVAWSVRYIGTLFCLLIITPFLVRWFAKPAFHRTGKEILETSAVFVLLLGINFVLFIKGVAIIGGIPAVYFLLIPLFWIALKLRPRFVTLALFLTASFAVLSLYIGASVPTADLFTSRLFQTEEFMIVLSTMFLIIVSLEEDRRLSANLLRSQVATLENAVARISSESSAKNDFISILGHELRNPLAPIVSAIELLQLKGGHDTEESEALTMMEDRMRTVRRLLDDLLDITRISEGKVSLKKERVELETALQRAIISNAHHIKERHQSLTSKPSKDALTIYGDPVRIEQIFSNLIANASRYSDTGENITISLRKVGGEAVVVVADHGIGIARETIDEIFTPFYQADPGARSKRGLGIGLALVKSFVEMHNGSVSAESKGVGHGSRFIVRLPLAEAEAKKVGDTKNIPSPLSPMRRSTGPSVLVVDDNDAAAGSMGRLLELKGCHVDYAYTGTQAIDKALIHLPDIVLLDVGLPDQEGYDVARTLRARGYKGKLVALTGYSTEDARAKGAEAGFEHYLIKPVGFADLQRVLPELG